MNILSDSFNSHRRWCRPLWSLALCVIACPLDSRGLVAQQRSPDTPLSSQADTAERARQLYVEHCAGCHGEDGSGSAVATKYLFPRPRDLRTGKFRLVSTQNSVPSREDLHAVLLRGMPGSSMPPWGHLPEADRELLVDEVYRLRAAGARDFYVNMLREVEGLDDDELTEEDVEVEINDYVIRSITAGLSSQVPELAETTPAAIQRGRELYISSGCAQCHGQEGKGDTGIAMFDAENMPSTARDFTLGIFKGGHDPQSLYRRIVYGMPGSPMPSSDQFTAEQVTDMIHFIRSLSTPEQRDQVVLNRETITAHRLAGTVPEAAQASEWSSIPAVELRVMPLWWRNGVAPDLRVQAVHDGRALAVRISWLDPSQDAQATFSESFKDAVAMQMVAGPNEPFLGMGSPQSPVDIWYWDANRQTQATGYHEPYPREVVDRYPLSEGAVDSPEIDRPGARLAAQPNLSLPARASGNPIVPMGGPTGASSLAAAGPGSATFRHPANRNVRAQGLWQEGRWSVVLTRPLATDPAAGGVTLSAGGQVSVAFALWDGAAGDRASQKSLTIWQDLKLDE